MNTLTHRGEASFVALRYSWIDVKTYLFVTLFAFGSVALPYILHLFPGVGLRFLPIYFFVLIAGYKFGPRVGMLTALASPLLSYSLIGMPAIPILYFVLIKSVALSLVASFVALRFQKLSFTAIVFTVALYQIIGSVFIFVFTQNLTMTFYDLTFGYHGLLLQLFGGYALLYLIRDYGKNV